MPASHSTKGTIFHKTRTLPHAIPTDVLHQFDMLLAQATHEMERGQVPDILKPVYWEALLILRRTGICFEDLIHLKELDDQARDCCLDQDSDGRWWLHIYRKTKKMVKEHRIPIKGGDGVVEALYRQRNRVKGIPSPSAQSYLFRNRRGLLKSASLRTALAKDLAPYLIRGGQPYVITLLQFRPTIAIEMLQEGVDIHTVKEFLGYTSLATMDRYVQYLPTSRIDNYDAWPFSPPGFCTLNHPPNLIPCPHYLSILPSALNARADLPLWQDRTKKLLITIESLRGKPAAGGTDQRLNLNQELQEVEKVIEAIQEERGEDGPCHGC